MDCSISKLGLELAGPSVAMEPAKMEMKQLLDFYLKGFFFFFFLSRFLPGQSAEQQKQQVDKKEIEMARRGA